MVGHLDAADDQVDVLLDTGKVARRDRRMSSSFLLPRAPSVILWSLPSISVGILERMLTAFPRGVDRMLSPTVAVCPDLRSSFMLDRT